MRDYVLELATKQNGMNAKLNTMREYLQAYILRIMHEEGVFSSTAFIGGTALRFLYNLPRYSQDLDFSLEKSKKLAFASLMKRIKDELSLAGYDVSITFNDRRVVQSTFIKFRGLMKDAGISAFAEQNLVVKIEVDTKFSPGCYYRNQGGQHVFSTFLFDIYKRIPVCRQTA
ncbi:MAG: nucleotidyl transferase AbiEii/AbiGii toxin family protein, partial [Candidatus Omnitrophica bacterium]|nr:nucleotidyl transferase AbiEii/AbiGii toxin family protein [Candidatus Omnitrophota bacterium]